MARRKRRRKWISKTTYTYKGGKYIRKKLAEDRGDCRTYRVKKVKGKNEKLLLCIRNKKGKRGGRTKAVALLKPKRK